ncbi:AEC family transporter [Lachnospiraceae bacterium DSM 108991]|uniref:AEC family transporter n=2 Tax=Lachnospiraceae TaxID=186803 RepID=A0A921I118_9FIRM|nr:AEC family transporter [Claveliimonas monacensis]MBE5062886.1 AEC family transporter [Claveliimonas monacensis]HJF93397.1 AEC family transporter [Lachnoclostridium phocaeense]
MKIDGLFDLQVMMFLLMAVGVVLRKMNIITKEGKGMLTDLVIDLILPCNIISAFYMPMDHSVFVSGVEILIISILIQIFCTFISGILYRKVPKEKRMVLQYATVCSNAGFLGNPVAEGLYGSVGLLYASVYLIPQRIVMWSAGVSYFTECPSKKEVVKKVLKHPCIVAVEIGIVLMVTQVQLPGFLSSAIENVGGCTTAITMMLIGTILTDVDMRHILTRTTVAYSFIRLAFIPAVVFAGCWLANIDSVVAGVSVTLAAMPAGTTTAILAMKYHGDEEFATQCVVLTTMLSMAAIPIWSLIIHSAL